MKTKTVNFTQKEASLIRRSLRLYKINLSDAIKHFENKINERPDSEILLKRVREFYETCNKVDKKIMKTSYTK